VQRRGVDRFELDLPGEQLVVVSVPTATEILEMLSPTERDIAHDVLAGLSNAAIARKRGRAPRTIANQLASLYRKLAIGSRAELAALMANA
jgi:DNA-binding NarL/FixJ family response regulator